MKRGFDFSVGEFYHLYNRGNNKSDIFLDDGDRRRFTRLLFLCNSTKPVIYKTVQGRSLDYINVEEKLVDIGAYCLMPNHFHILVYEKNEDGITNFLRKLSTAYSMFFNKKHERTGSLFENRFKAKHIDTDEYLKYLFSYIHLNPIKFIDNKWKENGIRDRYEAKKYLREYISSSYLDYMGVKREENVILNYDSFPDYFNDKIDFDDFIDEWLMFSID